MKVAPDEPKGFLRLQVPFGDTVELPGTLGFAIETTGFPAR